MYIYIDTTMKALAQTMADYSGIDRVIDLDSLPSLADGITIDNYENWDGPTVFYGSTLFDKSHPSYRFLQMKLGLRGALLYTDNRENSQTPIFAGKIPEDRFFNKLKSMISFAQGRLDYIDSFGVKYLGPVFSDPRNMVVLDNKKSFEEDAREFLNSVPDGWWHDLGIVTTGNMMKYEDFFDFFSYAIVLTASESAKNKMNFLNIPYCEIPAPDGSRDYGVVVRELANRRSSELYWDEQPSI